MKRMVRQLVQRPKRQPRQQTRQQPGGQTGQQPRTQSESQLGRQVRGNNAEKTAQAYLRRHGLVVVESNYHSRFGEIDLIMKDHDTLVFVEVRCRAENAAVSAAESITPLKMQKIRKTATYYLARFDEMPNCRFDVIAMTHYAQPSGSTQYAIDWIKNAF